MTTPTLYEGEAQIRRWANSSTQGASIVLSLPDADSLDSFVGKEGKRVMVVFVEIGNDEQPVPQARRKASSRAWLMCRDPSFQQYAASPGHYGSNESEAARYIREYCGIESRSELDSNSTAIDEFDLLCVDFNDWQAQRR